MRKLSVSIFAAVMFAVPTLLTSKAMAADMTVYKSPYCGCCTAWVTHMREHGFDVEVVDKDDISAMKRLLGVPEQLQSCHTAHIDGYVVEGHVPAADVKKMLAEKPEIAGLAVPGMPVGSPGMEQGERKDPYAVLGFGHKGLEVLNRY